MMKFFGWFIVLFLKIILVLWFIVNLICFKILFFVFVDDSGVKVVFEFIGLFYLVDLKVLIIIFINLLYLLVMIMKCFEDVYIWFVLYKCVKNIVLLSKLKLVLFKIRKVLFLFNFIDDFFKFLLVLVVIDVLLCLELVKYIFVIWGFDIRFEIWLYEVKIFLNVFFGVFVFWIKFLNVWVEVG